MIKAIGQNGLNFIASKFKELKALVDKKADKSEIKTKLSELTGDSTHRTVTDTEKSNWDNKVDKVAGKGLSANDYDSTAKAKVDAIPDNPKYTDTATAVVDNLTTDDATKALSAKQGKALQDNKADKSDISRCKTDGYNTSTVWGDISSTRDLEDWIGDFDKRTRELKNNKGLTGGKGEITQQLLTDADHPDDGGMNVAKWGRMVSATGQYDASKLNWGIRFIVPVEYAPVQSCTFPCDQGTITFSVDRDSSGNVVKCQAMGNSSTNRSYRTVSWNVVYFAASANS